MKVIDLLNKIANGDEIPKSFVYNKNTFNLNDAGIYKDNENNYLSDSIYYGFKNLNDRIEIIEDKKIEKLKLLQFSDLIDMPKEELVGVIKEQRFKINEIIDYINRGEK
jgi:hypothetical protein